VIRGRVIAALTTVVDLHAAIVLDDDPSAVSRTLGAIEGLDLALRLFEPVFEPVTEGPRAAPDELRRALARLRDDDGCIRRVRADAGRGEADADPGAVLAALEHARADSHAELMTLLGSARHGAWLARLRALATEGPPTRAKAKRRAATALPAMTRPLIRELRDRIVGLGESEDVPSFEGLDEPVRLLRDLVELTAPYADKACGRDDDDAQRLVALVDEVRQARSMTAWLRALAAASEPRTAWSAGVYSGMQIDRVAGAADALGPALLELRRKSRWAALTRPSLPQAATARAGRRRRTARSRTMIGRQRCSPPMRTSAARRPRRPPRSIAHQDRGRRVGSRWGT
jgi:hypothetical protein